MNDKTKKKIGIALPRQANPEAITIRYALELEALDPVAEIIEVDAATAEDFAQRVKHMDAIITSWGFRIDANVINQLENCTVIGVGSVGVDMVDIEAATAAGIVVTNVPDVFIEEVADHALMMMLGCARMMKTMNRMAAEGDWWAGRPLLSHSPRMMGQNLGLFAYGNVARCTARRAKAFGMRVVAYDPYVSELTMSADGVEPVSFNEMLEMSDFVSLHAPHNAETHHAFSTAAFERMRDHAVVINTARGPLIDETALIDALRSKAIAGAGLDVLETEPPAKDNPLLDMENVLLSPHVASATTRMRPETRRRVGREVALVLRGRWPMSCVNPTVLPRAPLERWQPYPMDRGPNR